jgi:anti-sigma factor RsiW
MPDFLHIHEDNLERYYGGRLEPERILAVERHLSDCQTCRERLHQLKAIERRELSLGTSWERGWRVTHGTAA